MKEVKLPEIKLFGKKIALPEIEAGENFSGESGGGSCKENSSGSDSDCCLDAKIVSRLGGSEAEDERNADKQETDKVCLAGEGCKTESKESNCRPISEESQNPKDFSDRDNSPDTHSVDEDSSEKQSPDSENDQSDTNNSQGKSLKKPDKILPCPRCNSMDTKFCYYNNYNVNQPRHFCKSCQRYWTAGGTMRNVPVGAGRRKNKNVASHCRHITMSDALQAAQMDVGNGFHHPNIKPNGTVLSFGPDLPICDSMAAVLKLNDKKIPNGCQNGFYKHEPGNSACGKGAENGNDFSSGLPISLSNQTTQSVQNGYQETVLQNVNSFPTPVTYFPNMACPFPAPIPVPVPAICPPGFPMPIYPAPLWNCGIAGPWSFPWMPPGSPVAVQKSSVFSPNSPTLGKHSRDGELLKPKNLEGDMCQDPKTSKGSILIPKTLRIDDPEEAAKSSIWTTLGIKYDSIGRGGLFKALQPKSNENKRMDTTSPMMLQANPAAFSRSLTFQEAS